ncbi:LLM class flavin-dependent oxidoreductase [Siccirubricoccus sp. KC 17139]|uniref:LLM class flavin-dependent oxidoreductase n=1 Tax=Siccirubricoccus soli TaxID=2899147 RepID=A0ABT1D767_9PROT|nr:LLM class flavin-dependent oxidoreductase [Siccirubricoccus soli]MCO6417773.1 LLM class flavin-dependent oxidoreductase [Siccirubricoccus soli]MCP2683908.1 LLM class flavin-dependent oxidoreductase [Siccirubricoccus soli]
MTHPLTFIGMIAHRPQSEIHPPRGPVVDADYIQRFALAHEAAGFDRILVAWGSTSPDALLVAQHAAAAAKRIGFMVAHRPGFIAPTLAARQFATFDQLTAGRAAIHVISGGSSTEQRKDGDYLDHTERYARSEEYVTLLKRLWTSDKPFDHEGRHYRFEGGFAEVKPLQQPHIPVFFGGSSDIAIEIAGRIADVYAFWGETLDQARETVARVRASVAKAGRDPQAIRFSMSFRPVLAATEADAWARANRIIERIRSLRADAVGSGGPKPESIGSRRLLEAAAAGPVRDKRLWTEVAAAVGAGANTTALVGTPEQVAESLADYHALGIDTFLIRGFDPLEDAVQFGAELLPATRAAIAARGTVPAAAE